MAKVVLENIYKSFPQRMGKQAAVPASDRQKKDDKSAYVSVLRSINLAIEDGEFMVLVGPSGCGKSTLLRLIAGLEEPTGGNIWVGDRLVNPLPPKERDIAMVFQNYALYPHLSVYDNIAFGLRRMGSKDKKTSSIEDILAGVTRNLPRKLRYLTHKEKAIDERVRKVAQLLQIELLLDRLPRQLSGGQKQRVALGRAIARNPQVFLMDEPLSNLDAKLRAETRTQIVKLQRQLSVTTIYVTHDQTEAMTMGDRIAVINEGEIQQLARPLDIYNRPANRFVAEFIGSPPMNFFSVEVEAPLTVVHSCFRLTLPDLWSSWLQPYNGRSLLLGVRPEHFKLSSPASDSLPVQVDLVEALGNDTYISVHPVDDSTLSLIARIPPDERVDLGDRIWLTPVPQRIHLFDPQTEKAIWQEDSR
ncbi:sugar ABC transporter ATP-binding protein [Hydrococcus rivularis NIES-593]|uniref:Sugar ABC transporter ATP-binding protein n=1 Tax=Hydrococcus rivularis NIES-593 TaxID=1921803 RepID=A0A1U7HR87_9CYAN|nr:ATP-binding cassette domain-containing protein [Hydrococcus rivularis]OKH26106.1 sugar ABC transporter ATP-binding protein [Hydrococcus rivularis NIES-593]